MPSVGTIKEDHTSSLSSCHDVRRRGTAKVDLEDDVMCHWWHIFWTKKDS